MCSFEPAVHLTMYASVSLKLNSIDVAAGGVVEHQAECRRSLAGTHISVALTNAMDQEVKRR